VNQFTQPLQHSADLLRGGCGPPAEADDGARRLITMLGYEDGDGERNRFRAALLSAGAKLKRLFQLRAPDAPGLVFFGGEADPFLIDWRGSGHAPISIAGAGLSLVEAFESCVAEGVEYLSQFEADGDVGRREPLDGMEVIGEARAYIARVLEEVGVGADRPIAWVAAKYLQDGCTAWLPADICLRRSTGVRDFVVPFKLSTGCGAGASFDDALLHGLCELIERDAVALWWRGGLRGRAIDERSAAGQAGAELLARLRGGSTRRTSWLLDITTDVGVPCVVAMSVAAGGRGFACGHAARPSRAAAVRSAITEMCQIELGQAVIAAKLREGGEAALNAADGVHLRRAALIDAARCVLLHPTELPPAEEQGPKTLEAILGLLARMGIEPLALDLTRPPLGIPVVRVVAHALQLEPSRIMTKRLAGIIEMTGGGEVYTGGVALL
jgi:ribosomal protein S12 methylthiotransferase accessory factor